MILIPRSIEPYPSSTNDYLVVSKSCKRQTTHNGHEQERHHDRHAFSCTNKSVHAITTNCLRSLHNHMSGNKPALQDPNGCSIHWHSRQAMSQLQPFEAFVGSHKITKKKVTNPSGLTLELTKSSKELVSPSGLLLELTKSSKKFSSPSGLIICQPFGAQSGNREVAQFFCQPCGAPFILRIH